MRKFITIFLFFTFLNSNYDVLFSQEKPQELSEIFSPYINIIDEHTNVASGALLKSWNNLEYLTFLNHLNTIFALIKDSYYREDEIYSNKEYQKLQFKKSISSLFTEIFGGLRIQSQIKDKDIYYIPEHLLDTSTMLVSLTNTRRHDGALVKIDGDNIIIYKVLEAKLHGDNYKLEQSSGVLERWRMYGVYVSKKLFVPDRLQLYSKSKTNPILVKYCTFNWFLENLVLYTYDDLKKETGIDAKDFIGMSEDIFLSLYSKDASKILEDINIRFIDRILFLLKKYIQIYNKIPAMSDEIYLRLTDNDIGISEEDKSYYESYFSSNNEKNKKDLVLSLYSIYDSNLLYSIFQERMYQFFNPTDIKSFYHSTKDLDTVTLVFISREKSIVDTLKNTLVSLLGEENKELIENYINKNRLTILRGKVRNYHKALTTKFNFLKEYFSEEDVKKLVIHNLKSFTLIWPEKMMSNFKSLYSLFQKEEMEHVFYNFLYAYFDRGLNSEYSSLEGMIDLISQNFMSDTIKNPRLRALKFVLDGNFENPPVKVIAAIRNSYNFLEYNRLKYFSSMSEEAFKEFCLKNINTLIYLDQEEFKAIVNILRYDYEFEWNEIEIFLVSNLKHIHMIFPKILSNKIAIIKGYLQDHGYDSSYIKNIIATKLYSISLIHIETAQIIVSILKNSLYKHYDYIEILYRWVIEEDYNFRDISSFKLKNAINFLKFKLKNVNRVHSIVKSIRNPGCLDENFLKFIFDNFAGNERDFLINNLDRVFTVLNTTGYKKSIIFLNQAEKNNSKKEQVYAFMRLNLGCEELFTKEGY